MGCTEMNKELKTKAKKEAKKERLRLEDVKFYRLMVEFILAVFLIYAVVQVGNNLIFVANKAAPVLIAVTGVLFAASAVYAVIVKRRGIDEKYSVITSAGLFGNAAVLFFSAAHIRLFMKPDVLLLSLILVALLYFVYSIYNNNFFVYSLITASGFIALCHSTLTSSVFSPLATLLVDIAWVLAIVIPAAAVVYAFLRLARGKATKKVACSVIVSAFVLLLGAVLALVYPVGVIYAEFALLAVYLVIAVSYTVKLM